MFGCVFGNTRGYMEKYVTLSNVRVYDVEKGQNVGLEQENKNMKDKDEVGKQENRCLRKT